MYIQHKEYLALLDQIQYLKKDGALLRQENMILADQLVKQREKRLLLEENHIKNMKLIEDLHTKTITHQVDNTKQIIDKMSEIDVERKNFIEDKFATLQNSSLSQLKQLQIKNTKTQLDFCQLNDFAGKLRKLYKQTLGVQNFKGKKQPSLIQILKWIKSIPGVSINFQKSVLSATMSSTALKKFGPKGSKPKQNKSILNISQSKQRINVSENKPKPRISGVSRV